MANKSKNLLNMDIVVETNVRSMSHLFIPLYTSCVCNLLVNIAIVDLAEIFFS